MKVLFTGFTSRTVGSERNVYDYMSNVFVLEQALKLAGHEVDTRPVSLETDPVIEEDYDCAVVGIAACQGFSSRFKLGALWALHRFDKRAAIFPSDGKNIAIFPNSVRTCLTGEHGDRSPFEYFLYGQIAKKQGNVVEAEIAERNPAPFLSTLERLPHLEGRPRCDWPVLIPTHSWGNPAVYQRHFGARVETWDPTHIAMPMQFNLAALAPDGRLEWAGETTREMAWVISSLQDQLQWIKKQKCKWPVITVGNKRAARKGEGADYVPELEMIETYYRRYWGHLAFGYPLAEGGWWRMRYVHAALAGIVTCCDENDARRMPDPYRHSRIMLERWSHERLADVAAEQHRALITTARTIDETLTTVDRFVRSLV